MIAFTVIRPDLGYYSGSVPASDIELQGKGPGETLIVGVAAAPHEYEVLAVKGEPTLRKRSPAEIAAQKAAFDDNLALLRAASGSDIEVLVEALKGKGMLQASDITAAADRLAQKKQGKGSI